MTFVVRREFPVMNLKKPACSHAQPYKKQANNDTCGYICKGNEGLLVADETYIFVRKSRECGKASAKAGNEEVFEIITGPGLLFYQAYQ